METRRLTAADRDLARRTFAMMSEVFEAEGEALSDAYPADDEDTHALDFYRALGGKPAAVTIFDWTNE